MTSSVRIVLRRITKCFLVVLHHIFDLLQILVLVDGLGLSVPLLDLGISSMACYTLLLFVLLLILDDVFTIVFIILARFTLFSTLVVLHATSSE